MNNNQQQNSSECPICLIEMGKGAALFTTACGHQFHFDCIMKCTKNGLFTCPLCRKDMPQLMPAQPITTSNLRNVPQQMPMQQMQQQMPMQQMQQQMPMQRMQVQRQQVPISRNRLPPTGNVAHFGSSFGSTAIPEDEALDEVVPMEISSTNNNASTNNNSQDSTLAAKVTFEYDQLQASEKKALFAMCSIVAPQDTLQQDKEKRSAMDIVCVIDKSGSMGGQKIQLLKLALDFVVQQLGSNDRLSIVEFDSGVRVLNGLTRCRADAKDKLHQDISTIHASGGTNIICGLRKGMEVLSTRKHKNPVASVLLLTDGQDGSSAHEINNMRQTEELGRFIHDANASIHAFGFGSDHDARVMSTIAECVSGTFTYVEDNDSIGPSFATVLGGLMSVVAQKITIKLQAHETCLIKSIKTSYVSSVSSDLKTGTISLPDLYAEEERDLVFMVELLPCQPNEESRPLTATIEWASLTSSKNTIAVDGFLSRPEVCKNVPQTNIKLDIQRNRSISEEAMQKALDLAQQNKFSEASDVYNNAIKQIQNSPSASTDQVQNLIKDLNETAVHTSNRSNFSQGGYAQVKSRQMQSTQQRACFNKAPVHSQKMNMCQVSNNNAWESFTKRH